MLRWIPREGWLLLTILLVTLCVHAANSRHGIMAGSDFLSQRNFKPLAKEIALLGIFALGAGIIIIAGGIDLSSGAVICFSGVVCAKTPRWLADASSAWIESAYCPMPLARTLQFLGLDTAAEPFSIPMIVAMFVVTLSVGLAIGLFHALLINRLGLPPFVATLSTMAGLRSLASVITTGSIAVSDGGFRTIGRDWHVPVLLFLTQCVALGVLMRFTPLGRHLYALGGNESAARLSGLNVAGLKRFAYVLGAVASAFAGIVYLAHSGQASAQVGVGYELAAIAAAVIGGCNLKGGAGTVLGIFLGVVLLRIVINSTVFVIEFQATEWEGFIVGVVVILAVLLGKIGAPANQ